MGLFNGRKKHIVEYNAQTLNDENMLYPAACLVSSLKKTAGVTVDETNGKSVGAKLIYDIKEGGSITIESWGYGLIHITIDVAASKEQMKEAVSKAERLLRDEGYQPFIGQQYFIM